MARFGLTIIFPRRSPVCAPEVLFHEDVPVAMLVSHTTIPCRRRLVPHVSFFSPFLAHEFFFF